MLHRSATEVDGDAVSKSGVTDREAGCEEDEVFQMIPEPQTPPEENGQSSSTLVGVQSQDEAERLEAPEGSANSQNNRVGISSSVEVVVNPVMTTTLATPSAETDSDLVVSHPAFILRFCLTKLIPVVASVLASLEGGYVIQCSLRLSKSSAVKKAVGRPQFRYHGV